MVEQLINRIDEIIVFHKLQNEEIKQIINIMLSQVMKRLSRQNIEIEISEEVKDKILENGVDTNFGARPLKRAIQNMLEDKIAEAILDGKIKKDKKAIIELNDEKEIVIK